MKFVNTIVIFCILIGCTIPVNVDENTPNTALGGAAPYEESENQVVVTNFQELRMAVEQDYPQGDITILCDDGVYQWPDWEYFNISGENTTIRSLSGDRDSVIFRGQGMDGNGNSVLHITADYVSIRDLTISDSKNHGIQIHGEEPYQADHPYISNVVFKDIREQMIKGSGNQTEDHSDYGVVENCLFYYTAGVAYQYYSGGIDVHRGNHWVVRNNLFRDLASPNSTLSEGAIHFWSQSGDTHIEGNRIIGCDRGIMLGFDSSDHFGAVVKNNFIHVIADTGIYLCNTRDVNVYNNTVYVDSSYPNAIEYRFNATQSLSIVNNCTNRQITSRNGAEGNVDNNVTHAAEEWFVDASQGDLHLAGPEQTLVDKAMELDEVQLDIDGSERDSTPDIGAHEYGAS